ncbi:MAG: hypothetical protein ABSE47_17000 [Acidimicrobiales bacterium]
MAIPITPPVERDPANSHDEPEAQSPSQPDAPLAGGAHRRRLRVIVVVAIYVGLGVLSNLPSLTGGLSHTMACGNGSCGDPGQEVWFLAWAAHAVAHLQNPLRTNWIDYPFGVDLADNTSMPLAGVLGAPITWLFGPIATYNVLFSLGFAGSASAAFFMLRRFVTWDLAAFVGGLLYGFCPFMIGEGDGHLFLILAAVPPLVLALLDEILVRQRRRWWWMGFILGIVMVVQLGWSAELLVDTLTLAGIGVVVLCIARPQLVSRHFRYAAKAILLACVVLAPVALWFAVTSRTGPDHLTNASHSVAVLAGLSADPASLVIPTQNQYFSFGLAHTGNSFVGVTPTTGPQPDPAENGSYVGIPVILLLLAGGLRFRRDRLLLFAILMAVVALLLSLGSHLHVWGHLTAIPLPFLVFTKLPFLQAEVASRYSLFMWLFVASAVALILDRARDARPPAPAAHRRDSNRGLARFGPLPLMAALTVIGLVSLVPGWPYTDISAYATPPALVPPTVGTGSPGSALLTYPLASGKYVLPMVWQAVDDFPYRLTAGEAAVGTNLQGALAVAFNVCTVNPTLAKPPHGLVQRARKELAKLQVRTVIIPETGSVNPACAVRFISEVLNRPPTLQRGAAVWSSVQVPGASP